MNERNNWVEVFCASFPITSLAAYAGKSFCLDVHLLPSVNNFILFVITKKYFFLFQILILSFFTQDFASFYPFHCSLKSPKLRHWAVSNLRFSRFNIRFHDFKLCILYFVDILSGFQNPKASNFLCHISLSAI